VCFGFLIPFRGVMFYKYVVQTIDQGFKWQDGANNLLVLPDPWDIPQGSVFMQDDNFSGLTKQAGAVQVASSSPVA
jgi:hypothetical protein